MRHILGEDLDVGCVLSWGPCWYAQKAFFEGKDHPLSTPENLMRYDVEVSGFPSSHAGHLCLLRLKEDDYPGTTRIEEWPSWDLPVLKWGKSQGGVVGFSHSGWGLKTKDASLPSLEVPPFDGIGANEYIVDVAHDAVDFISAVDTPAPWELNIWYHTLNCGYRARISGETDFPCIYGERVGLGPVLRQAGRRRARLRPLGRGDQGRPLVRLRRQEPPGRLPGGRRPRRRGGLRAEARRARPVTVSARVAAWLDPKPSAEAEGDPRPAARREAVLGPRAGPDRRVADGPGRGRRQRPGRRPEARSRPTAQFRDVRVRGRRSSGRAGSPCGSTRRRTPTRSS